MGEPLKGTVTSLSSIYSPEDAQKASVRVQETISERQKEVQQLQSFLNDNTNLVNLVKKLPDQLHHDIMVPFGKAAFFPGKLIHTNEFLVLLGEGYYADRTSKQTVEILKRRGKDLESQIETLNAVIKDLKFEASFFDETATEAAEGVVEIREDYVEEVFDEERGPPSEDEFARILSRIDELEKEEMELEMAEEGEEEEEEDKADLSHLLSRTYIEPEITNSKVLINDSQEKVGNEHLLSKRSLQNDAQQNMSKPFKAKDSQSLSVSKDSDKYLSSNIKAPTSSASNPLPRPIEHKKLESLPHTPVPKNEVSNFGSSTTDRNKAFTGSIVEHTHNMEKSQIGQPSAPASKPVSRFKMQRK